MGDLITGIAYERQDGDLDAIAALATTTYGRGVLELNNIAAAISYLALGNTKLGQIVCFVNTLESATAVTTGRKGIPVIVPFACTITGIVCFTSTGTITWDIWKDTYANHPPTVADTIFSGSKPAVTTGGKSVDTTLTGVSTSLSVGDELIFNVDAVSGPLWAAIYLNVTKT